MTNTLLLDASIRESLLGYIFPVSRFRPGPPHEEDQWGSMGMPCVLHEDLDCCVNFVRSSTHVYVKINIHAFKYSNCASASNVIS